MQTSNFLRTFGEAFPQGCRNCMQSVNRNVISKETLFEKFLTFCMFSDSQWKKMRTVGEKASARASNEISMYLDDCSRKTTLVVRKTLSSIFELSEEKVWEIDEIISAVFSKENSTFPDKTFARKSSFRKFYVFFYFFSTLKYLFSVSLLKLCCRNLKSLIWKPNQMVSGRVFFFKLCSFVIFADIEFPSDFRRSFSTGLPKLYSEFSVEHYQQRDTFLEISYFLHVFGLSVKKNEDRWRKSFARDSNEKSMYLDDCLRKQTLVVRKTLSSIFELSEEEVREIDEIISAVCSKENSTFPDKTFARKLFFRKFYVFVLLFFDIEKSVLRLFAETLL